MIYAIADLHFDSSGKKPMDVFGQNWLNHQDKIIENWKAKINDEDLVLIPGDISWALKLDEAYEDLIKIDKLPGKKILIKGNHDYWWNSLTKLNELGLETISFLQNNSYIYDNIAIVGTRGWSPIDNETAGAQDQKVFSRELNRLRLSLDSINKPVDKIIVMLHYPPFDGSKRLNEFFEIMKEYNVDVCIYGHLHSDGHKYVIEGEIEGIEMKCIACDYIEFNPQEIILRERGGFSNYIAKDNMKIIVKKNYEEVSKVVADMFIEEIQSNPEIVLGLATGSTPIGTYQEIIKAHKEGLDLSTVRTFNLDEYLGLDGDNPQSYRYFMNEQLFNHVNIKKENTHVPNGKAENILEYCKEYDEMILASGGIDIQILGIGENGHIAFNEPAEELRAGTNVVNLTENTIEVNARFFDSIDEVPKQAITMGMGSILKAKKIVLVATGKKKAPIIKELLNEDKITTMLPASFLLLHPNVTIVVDEEAYNG